MAWFSAYGLSHWVVLAITVLGAAALVLAGRRAPGGVARGCAWGLASVIVALNVTMQVWAFDPASPAVSLPLQISDLAPYASAIALVTRRPWAAALTYYWGITLSTQALLTPVLNAPDFPGVEFIAFFAIHVLVVWAAIFLTWGLGVRPSWWSYRFTLAATVCWAAAVFVINSSAGSNYGFLNRKPSTGSILDLLGPWPWYLLPEFGLVVLAWAIMTWPWHRRAARTGTLVE